MKPHDTSALDECIAQCLHCYRTCFETAMTVCLEHGGAHVAPAHFRLMMACAEVCRAAASVMMARLPDHGELCRLCAKLCLQCAADCDKLHEMGACAAACRECARHCRDMAH